MTALVGANVNNSWTSAELTASGSGFAVGDQFTDHNGKRYVFVKTSAAVAQYDAVTYDETYSTTVAPLTTSNDARGDKVGVAPVAIASGSYGWLQIEGPCTLTVKASCAANVRLNTTATYLDDDGTAGSMQVEGIYLTTARGGTDGSAAAILNFPIIGVTL